MRRVDADLAARFARLALACVPREYPGQVSHVLRSDADARPPRELTPIFFGCYDWHSAVHGHWTLVRLHRAAPGHALAAESRRALARGLTPEKAAAELAYLRAAGRAGFERPYGLAWLVTLDRELREWEDAEATAWAAALRPLAAEAAERLRAYFAVLPAPVRTGEHAQTAFALGLALDAVGGPDGPGGADLAAEARRMFATDRDWPLRFEPGGTDFLSPGLAEADLVRRLLPPGEFARWLTGFLPRIDLEPARCPDPEDGKLAHLDGLNLSRAWMLEGIAAGLPEDDARRAHLAALAAAHAEAGLAAVTGAHYAGGHWLATFAVYLLTGRGLPPE